MSPPNTNTKKNTQIPIRNEQKQPNHQYEKNNNHSINPNTNTKWAKTTQHQNEMSKNNPATNTLFVFWEIQTPYP